MNLSIRHNLSIPGTNIYRIHPEHVRNIRFVGKRCVPILWYRVYVYIAFIFFCYQAKKKNIHVGQRMIIKRRKLTRDKVREKYAGKIKAIDQHETTLKIQKSIEFWNKTRLAMMTLTVAALTWIVSESSRLVIERSIPADKQTPITLGIIVMIVLLIILASHFNVHSE
tara:strand:+ start:521 stop:1024 length:504 start_codon:yes stop_codon:yes gene_type:complete